MTNKEITLELLSVPNDGPLLKVEGLVELMNQLAKSYDKIDFLEKENLELKRSLELLRERFHCIEEMTPKEEEGGYIKELDSEEEDEPSPQTHLSGLPPRRPVTDMVKSIEDRCSTPPLHPDKMPLCITTFRETYGKEGSPLPDGPWPPGYDVLAMLGDRSLSDWGGTPPSIWSLGNILMSYTKKHLQCICRNRASSRLRTVCPWYGWSKLNKGDLIKFILDKIARWE